MTKLGGLLSKILHKKHKDKELQSELISLLSGAGLAVSLPAIVNAASQSKKQQDFAKLLALEASKEQEKTAEEKVANVSIGEVVESSADADVDPLTALILQNM